MNEKPIQDQDEAVEEKRFKRSGGRAGIPGLLLRCPQVALLLVPLMLGTIVLVHGKAGWMFTNKDGGWEYPAFWIVGLLVLALLGDGSAALGPMMGL